MENIADKVSTAFDILNNTVITGNITLMNVIEFQIANDINKLMHEKGDDIARYQIFLDRVMDLKLVISSAISKAEQNCCAIVGKGSISISGESQKAESQKADQCSVDSTD
ncbi:MAG: hypothetical protein WC919_01385 [Candidatus Paceibacterota bacterium]|jgi:hypothetical protein